MGIQSHWYNNLSNGPLLDAVHWWVEWSAEAKPARVGVMWSSATYNGKSSDPERGKYLRREAECIAANCSSITWNPADSTEKLVQQVQALLK